MALVESVSVSAERETFCDSCGEKNVFDHRPLLALCVVMGCDIFRIAFGHLYSLDGADLATSHLRNPFSCRGTYALLDFAIAVSCRTLILNRLAFCYVSYSARLLGFGVSFFNASAWDRFRQREL